MERGPSLQGRGARFEKKMPGGRWTHANGVVHINIFELLAIFFFCIKIFVQDIQSKYICFETDNTIVFSYINATGSMQSDKSTVEKWNW